MKFPKLAITHTIIALLCLMVGYTYSNRSKEDEIWQARSKELNLGYRTQTNLNIASASVVLDLVNFIESNDHKSFQRKSCRYLKIINRNVSNYYSTGGSFLGKREEEIKEIIKSIQNYIKVGEAANNCSWPSIDNTPNKSVK